MALLAKRGGPKEQVRNAYSAFYRVLDSTVTSFPGRRMTSPALLIRRYPFLGDVGKRLYRSRGRVKTKMVGLRLLKDIEVLATVRVQKGHIRVYRDIYIHTLLVH